MGKSLTCNVVPVYAGDGYLTGAMTKLDMEFLRIRSERAGFKIVEWRAQTKRGQDMLGGQYVADSDVPHLNLVPCICHNGRYNDGRNCCPVCDGLGVTLPNRWKKWLAWQVEMFKS